MEQPFDLTRLIALRKLTTALSEYFSAQISQHLTHLAPLLNPRLLLGELIRGEKFTAKGGESFYQELAALYQSIAPARPFNATLELKPPLDIFGITPEIVPASYSYVPQGGSKPITIRSPLKWVLSYKDLSPNRLQELIVLHQRSGGLELRSALLHYLVLYLISNKPTGISAVMRSLGYPFAHSTVPEFGKLPLTFVCSPVSSLRPPDEVIVMNTELSGTDTFDEVVNLDELLALADPVQAEIRRLVAEHAGSLIPAAGA
jgi:hypothetical protein